jgi:hypothetical protein
MTVISCKAIKKEITRENNAYMISEIQTTVLCAGLIWLRIVTSGRLFRTR